MTHCPYCNADLSESPLQGGRCPACSNMLSWHESPLQGGAAPASIGSPQPQFAPGIEYGSLPPGFGAPPVEYNPPAPDPLVALKATMARIVMRGAAEGSEVARPLGPTLLPPGAGMDDRPVQSPLVVPMRELAGDGAAPQSSMPAESVGSSGPADTERSHPTPISPRSYPTPRGSFDRTIELDSAANDTNRATPVDIRPVQLSIDDGAASELDSHKATIDIPAPKEKQPSTFDDRRFAKTMDSGSVSAEDTEQVAKLWRGTFDPKTTPRTSLKGSGGATARDSKLVIKHRAVRDVRDPATAKGADYELLSVIGEGGMGVVYSARQAAIDRTVAIKMLKKDIARDTDQREKFLSEAVVTGDLDHPNIVPIYDLGSNESGALFYSMKRVQGTPWMSVIDQKSAPENIDILMKVADAVAFAHSRGVIHRDLKPENVMLGDFGEVLVMDWGLALSTAAFRKSGSITQTSSMGGTPAYMAPEMATGPIDRVGQASDVYLLGAILYEIITKKPPHTGKNVMNCLFAAARNEIQPTNQTGELLEIAMKAMSTTPENRYPSVQDLQAAIRLYQSHSESIVLSDRAQHDLDTAEKTGDYQTYSRALFAFQEAAALWDGNTKARAGVSTAKLAYAQRAMKKEDFDLAASLVDPTDVSHIDVHRHIVKAQRERDTRQQRLRNVRRIALGLGVCIVIVASIATVLFNAQKNRAVTAEFQAKGDRDKALIAEGVAKQEKVKADKSADDARQSAIVANQAKGQAQAAAVVAQNAKKLAEEDANRAKQAKQAEEYQAYVARIGLAAAQIDGNAFDAAENLLAECPEDLRDWEWGRLKFLSTQSVSDFRGRAPVDSVAFDPSGRRFASGSWDGDARVWDLASGKALVTIPYGAEYVHAVAFSPDGKLVATGGNDPRGYVKIWNAQSGQLVKAFHGHTDDVLSVEFSHDGRRLLTSSYDKTARLWDVETGQLLRTYIGHNWWVWSAQFSPDESQIVTASQDGTAMIWNTATGASKPFMGHKGPVYTAVFSPDGKFVVSGGYDDRVLIWDPVSDAQPLKIADLIAGNGATAAAKFRALVGHSAPVHTVALSRDGKLVLSGSNDNSIKLWDFKTGKLIKTLRGHAGWVDSAVFSPDGDSVLSGSHDTDIKLWSIKGYEEVRVLQGRLLAGHQDAVLSVACSRDGKRVVTSSRDRTAKLWDVASGDLLQTFEEGHDYLASTAAFFPDGKRLLTAAADNTTRIWDLTTGTQLLRLEDTGRNSVAVLSHDGRLVLTGGDEAAGEVWTARLWDAATGRLLHIIKPISAEVSAVAFSPDDSKFFVGDAHGHCTLWNTATGAKLAALDSHTGKITGAQFTEDGSRVLTASNDNSVGQWDLATGKEPLRLILKHSTGVAAVAIIPHTTQALTLDDDGIVRLWDIDRAQMLGVIGGEDGTTQLGVSADGRYALWVNYKNDYRTVRIWSVKDHRQIGPPGAPNSTEPYLKLTDGLIWSAALSSDAQYLVTVGGNGARLWDFASGIERMSFTPNGAVASARFSPDGSRIVTGSWDNSAKIWNVATGRAELKLLGHRLYVNSAEFSPDGRWVLTASDDHTARIWNAATGRMVRELVGHEAGVTDATFSPDGQLILTASADKTARVWDAQTGKQLHVYRGHLWGLLSAAFSRDGKRIITGSSDKTAKIWDVETEQCMATLAGHTAAVTSVAFSPDGRRALTGSQDETAKLWDAEVGREILGKEILTLKGHTQEVTSVAFSDDGSYVVTGSRDGTAIIWLATDWHDAHKPKIADERVTEN